MKKIYIFRGAPSSGKGTIIKEFMKFINGKIALLELDKFRWGFHLINREVFEVTEAEHQLAYDNYLQVLEGYLQNGNYTIVTEGLFSWDTPSPHGNMQDIIQMCRKYNYETVSILLYGKYDVLWERNIQREYSVPEDEFKILYDNVMDVLSEDEIKIDVTQNEVSESVNKLISYI